MSADHQLSSITELFDLDDSEQEAWNALLDLVIARENISPENQKAECTLKFKLLTVLGFPPPINKTVEAAGLDLRCSVATTIPAGGRKLIPLNIAIEISAGCYERIAPRSGLALNFCIGIIDRGEIFVLLVNFSRNDFVNRFFVNRGDRIAQLILEKTIYPSVIQVNNLTTTLSGNNGFGSTESNFIFFIFILNNQNFLKTTRYCYIEKGIIQYITINCFPCIAVNEINSSNINKNSMRKESDPDESSLQPTTKGHECLLKVKMLNELGFLPIRLSDHTAGLDLKSPVSVIQG